MRRPCCGFIALAVCAAGLVPGCMNNWRPPLVEPAPQRNETFPPLSACLQANRLGRWKFHRYPLPRKPDETPETYAKVVTPERSTEGILVGRALGPLRRYMPTPATQPAQGLQPPEQTDAPMEGGLGLFLTIDPPLAPIPEVVERDEPAIATTTIRYFDTQGRASLLGTLIREVSIEGIEDVECPAGRFEDCLRIRVDLKIQFPLSPFIDWTSYFWLSPEVGEVRRIQKVSGWFLIFWFGSAHEFELVEYQPAAVSTDPLAVAPPWDTGGVILDKGVPHPSIAGLIVDFARQRTEP